MKESTFGVVIGDGLGFFSEFIFGNLALQIFGVM
jgi:hypothetical protein